MTIGIWQIVLIAMAVLLLLGAGGLPRVVGGFAKGIKPFRTGLNVGQHAAVQQPNAAANSAVRGNGEAMQR